LPGHALRRTPDAARLTKGEQAIWQHRYWEHQIRDETDFARHVDYIHYNPVKHGLARSPLDWPYSSFGRYVKAGVYAPDWGSDSMCFEGIGHE
jgi:putative transposase